MKVYENLFRQLMKLETLSRLLFLFIIAFLTIPVSIYSPLGYGLDHSWMIAIHMAFEKNITFGSEILFTYGPLGFLAIRLPFAVPVFFYWLFDFYLLINLIYVFNLILKSHNSIASLTVSALTIILLQDFRDHDIVMVLTWFFIFMLFQHATKKHKWLLINAIILALIVFYTKVNLGIVDLTILFIYLAFQFFSKEMLIKEIGFFLLGIAITIGLSSILLNVNLPQYILGSLHLISAYNDAMFEPLINKWSNPVFTSAILLVVLFALYLLYYIRNCFQDKRALFNAFVILLILFIQFKQGFVRLHTESFFQYITPFLLLLFLFSSKEVSGHLLKLSLFSLFVGYVVVGSSSILFGPDLIGGRLNNLSKYFRDSRTDYASFQTQELIEAQRIPQATLDQITGNVDIIPWDISYIYFNNLEYKPRPVIQTYSAYNSYLDKKNADAFRSKNGPQFVLIKYESIDNRYPLFDESYTKLSILENYEIVNNTWDHLLLRRKNTPIPVRFGSESIKSAKLSDYIPLKSSSRMLFFKADIKYSLLGKLARLIFQPPQLDITLITSDGVKKRHKSITTILSDGVIINKFVSINDNKEDLEVFLATHGKNSKSIIAVKFHTNQKWGFQEDYFYNLSEIVSEAPPLGRQYSPIELDISGIEPGGLRFNVESINNKDGFAAISGWAYAVSSIGDESETYTILKSESKIYFFPTAKIVRKDVSDFVGQNIDYSGFRSFIIGSQVEDGIYDVGLLIKQSNGKMQLDYCGKQVRLTSTAASNIDRTSWLDQELRFSIDQFADIGDKMDVKGWAFAVDHKNDNLRISIVLESGSDLRVFDAKSMTRPDVNKFFNRNDVGNCGFEVSISKFLIPTGTYSVGFLVENEGKAIYSVSGKLITINR